jgi:hypothetical protein
MSTIIVIESNWLPYTNFLAEFLIDLLPESIPCALHQLGGPLLPDFPAPQSWDHPDNRLSTIYAASADISRIVSAIRKDPKAVHFIAGWQDYIYGYLNEASVQSWQQIVNHASQGVVPHVIYCNFPHTEIPLDQEDAVLSDFDHVINKQLRDQIKQIIQARTSFTGSLRATPTTHLKALPSRTEFQGLVASIRES